MANVAALIGTSDCSYYATAVVSDPAAAAAARAWERWYRTL